MFTRSSCTCASMCVGGAVVDMDFGMDAAEALFGFFTEALEDGDAEAAYAGGGLEAADGMLSAGGRALCPLRDAAASLCVDVAAHMDEWSVPDYWRLERTGLAAARSGAMRAAAARDALRLAMSRLGALCMEPRAGASPRPGGRIMLAPFPGGEPVEYGSEPWHSLRISGDGRSLVFEDARDGGGSAGGSWRFVPDGGRGGREPYANVGGFAPHGPDAGED